MIFRLEYISLFEDYLKSQKNLSASSVECYIRDVRKFSEFANGNSLTFDKAAVEFMNYLNSNGTPNSSKVRYLCSLRAFADYMVEIGYAEKNPFSDISAPKVVREKPQFLTVAETQALLSQPDTTTRDGLRDRVALELAYQTGLKINDLLNLNVDNYNLMLNVINFKQNGFERIIPIVAPLNTLMSDYLNARMEILKGKIEKALLVNMRGGRLTRQGFNNIVGKHVRSAEIEGEVTARTLRLSLAAHMVESGASVRDLRTVHTMTQGAANSLYNTIADLKFEQARFLGRLAEDNK